MVVLLSLLGCLPRVPSILLPWDYSAISFAGSPTSLWVMAGVSRVNRDANVFNEPCHQGAEFLEFLRIVGSKIVPFAKVISEVVQLLSLRFAISASLKTLQQTLWTDLLTPGMILCCTSPRAGLAKPISSPISGTVFRHARSSRC